MCIEEDEEDIDEEEDEGDEYSVLLFVWFFSFPFPFPFPFCLFSRTRKLGEVCNRIMVRAEGRAEGFELGRGEGTDR